MLLRIRESLTHHEDDLQHHREAQEETANGQKEAHSRADMEARQERRIHTSARFGAASVTTAGAGRTAGRTASETTVYSSAITISCRARSPSRPTPARRRSRVQRARVLARGILGAAGVVLGARCLASGIIAAVAHALDAPLRTDVVGEGLGVFGDVGAEAVGADAGVG